MAVRGLGAGRKAALLINECQRGLLDPSLALLPDLAAQAEQREILPRIKRLLACFRAQGLPIFHLPFVYRPDLADLVPNSLLLAMSSKSPRLFPDRPEAEPMPGLEPLESEFVVSRTANLIAFNQTALDATLRRLGVRTVVLTGISTNVAIPGNAFAAVDCGYDVVIPEDCIAGGSAEAHRVIVDQQLRMVATITDSDSVIAALQEAAPAAAQ